MNIFSVRLCALCTISWLSFLFFNLSLEFRMLSNSSLNSRSVDISNTSKVMCQRSPFFDGDIILKCSSSTKSLPYMFTASSSSTAGFKIANIDQNLTIENLVSRITLRREFHNFPKSCPCVYDAKGECRQASHMCVASVAPSFCDIQLINATLPRKGGILDCGTLSRYSFNHPSIKGGSPMYYPLQHDAWAYRHDIHALDFKRFAEHKSGMWLRSVDIVVPLKSRWDDCFNHLSFETLPIIAHVWELHGQKWQEIHWHASLFSAALLRLMDVPQDRILVDETIVARTLLLPWIEVWLW